MLNLWPTPDAGPAPGGWVPPSPWPAEAGEAGDEAGQRAADEVWDDGPPHRVESAFDVWQEQGPAPEPGPDPLPAVPGPPDGVPAVSARPADEWVVRDPAPRPDADPLPPAAWPPPAGLVSAADEPPAEPARPAQADHAPVRPKASRGSRPAAGWNPDSEEDWLRVLRGLRASDDDR